MSEVKILAPKPISGSAFKTRINPFSGNNDGYTAIAQESASPRCLLCSWHYHGRPLSQPSQSWNFVFGQAPLRDRIGVLSFARYDPAFYGEKCASGYRKILLRRCCNVLAHETAHMFGLLHCISFKCVMNGSNHLRESDARPLYLCPVRLHKLQFGIGFDLTERYRRLLGFCRTADFDDDNAWVPRRLKRIMDDVQEIEFIRAPKNKERL